MINQNGKKYKRNFFIFIFLITLIFISNKLMNTKSKYNTVYAGDKIQVENTLLLVKNIIKTEEKFIIEFIDENYIENSEGYIFKIQSKKKVQEEIKPEVKVRYKSYIKLEMDLKNGYENLKIGIAKNEKKKELNFVTVYFNEFEIPINKNYIENTEKEDILNYLTYMIEYQNIKIDEENKLIEQYNLDIIQKENENEELKRNLEFELGSEKEKTNSKITSNNTDILSIKDDILKSKNKIIELKNKILILDAEIIYIKTGEKREVKLLELLDKNNEKTIKNDKNIEKEVKNNKEINEKIEEKPKEVTEDNINNSNNNQENYNNNTNNYNNYNSKTTKEEPKTQPKQEEKQQPILTSPPKKIIKPIKNDKENKEVEIEFKP